MVQEEHKAGGRTKPGQEAVGCPNAFPTLGVLVGPGTVAGGAAKWGLDPHPWRKAQALPISTPKLQPPGLGRTLLPSSLPLHGDPASPRPFPAHRGSSDVPFSATGSSLTFFFP